MNIPLPGSFGKAFVEGADTGSNMLYRLMQSRVAQQQADTAQQLAPYDIAAKQAQAYEGMIKAKNDLAQMNMFRKYIGLPPVDEGSLNFPGAPNAGGNTQQPQQPQLTGQASPTGQVAQQGQQTQQGSGIPSPESGNNLFKPPPGLSDQERLQLAYQKHAAMKDYFKPPQVIDEDGSKYLLTPFDSKIPITNAPTTREKDFYKSDVKAYDKSVENTGNLTKILNIGEQYVNDVLASPFLKDIKAHPWLFNADLAFYRKQNSPLADTLARMSQLNGNLNQAFLQGFKGAARQWESKIGDKAKAQDSDTLYTVIAKTEGMIKLAKLQRDRELEYQKNIRDKQMTESQALLEAEKTIKYEDNAKAVEKEIDSALAKGGTSYDRGGKAELNKRSIMDLANKKLAEARAAGDTEAIKAINARTQQLLAQAKG